MTGESEGVRFVMQRGSRGRGAFASAKTPASMPVAGPAKAVGARITRVNRRSRTDDLSGLRLAMRYGFDP
jgi:hypothetical protein